jgi:hypothetical protein
LAPLERRPALAPAESVRAMAGPRSEPAGGEVRPVEACAVGDVMDDVLKRLLAEGARHGDGAPLNGLGARGGGGSDAADAFEAIAVKARLDEGDVVVLLKANRTRHENGIVIQRYF